ncbi:tRNA-specific adenosine deaminase, chloroplastic -like protein [Gossypium arboreum]|uniref:Uncharacterized protein n=2 Tax=Gossypium arboreum TaxID=29729 RepID=A0ABR0MSL8_GOSAR|nr:tRNA(adenine(34)) deaminase, chloroplastic [Gossypium arboreum]KAK5776976.1 hypothetical protein PVK06_044941 [Gossypium arboreum]KHG19417.1 tRNA-specific adenosine deaminase, chloroplastic -like protein [Gossypium arboreum]
MYSSYSISSSVLSLRRNGSLSFSFNDCSSNVFNSSLDKTPLSSSPCSSCCSYCACCCATFACATPRLPITPCFLYGLRQSALVHCSPSRRLILPAGHRCLVRFPTCDLDRGAFEVSTASILTRKTKGRFRCVPSEESAARCLLGGVDAAEAMISLLSEEMNGECLGTAERNRSSYKIVKVSKARDYDSKCDSLKKKIKQVDKLASYGNECSNGTKQRKKLEERRSHANECYRQRTKIVGSSLLESDCKDEYESTAIESREESRRKAESESSLTAENRRGRTKSSSCSSYYSLSSSGDLESDTELPEPEQFMEESFSGHVTESIGDDISRSEGQVTTGLKRDNGGGNSVDWDLRKKSEKKLAEVSAEEIQSGAKYSHEYARRVKNDESDYAKRSNFHDQLDVKDWEIRKGHTHIRQSESRRKNQDIREISKIHVSDVDKTSQEKHFMGGEANVELSEIRDSTERISTLQQQSESRMKIEEEDRDPVQSWLGSRMKIWEEDTTMAQSSFQQTRKQQQQRGERITGQLEMRRKSSEINEAKNKKTSISQSETQKKKQDDTSSLNFTSNPETKKQSFPKDKKLPQRIEPGQGMQAITNISIVHADSTKLVTNSQTSSGERLAEHENNFTPALGLINERSQVHEEANSRVQQTKSRKENLKPTSVSSSWGKAREGSSFQAYLSLVSETREQQSHVDLAEPEKGSTEDVLMPPQPQAIAGGLLHDDSMTRISTEASGGTSESGSATYLHSRGRAMFAHHESEASKRSETYGESLNLTTHEGSLGSAQRLEESSLQIVGEFVEKARHDVVTSGVQQGNRISDFTSAYEGDKHGPGPSGQHGKEELKIKRHDSRQSSKGSGGKGPSDEMWDVTDSPVQELPEAETQGISTSGHAVIKRSGRSLWTLMGDIIRLRWSSRSQTPSSAARSGGRTSPNESVGSETWFSGHEQNENNDENLRRERSSLPSEVVSYQLGQGTQGEGVFSDSMRSTEKVRPLEGNISPSSNILETAPASEVISLTSQKEKHDESSFEVAPSGKEVVQSSLPLPAGSTRTSLVVEEISETDKVDTKGSGSVRVMEQPVGARLAEASGSQGKEGELKQRKLQRTKQVPRDRFDEWEEAYRLEREQQKIDEMFMREALLEAKKAADSWEVPVGAVLVQHGKIIARGRNLVEELRDSTAHAEMICIREASSILHSWRLADTTLYVTLEPCPMCAGAILQARIDTLVWGAPNKLLGADGSWVRLFPDERGGNGSEQTDKPAAPVHPFHPNMGIRRGVLASECADMMQHFFQLRRKNKGKNAEQLSSSSSSCLPITTSHRSKLFTKIHDVFHLMFCL